jgi:acetoacetyl-CoA synthetase
VRLCCAIERHTGKFIDIDTLVANSTPRKLAARLFAGEEKQAQRALRLNTGSGSPILFCAPGQIWNPNSLRQIASHLEQVATAISISLPGLEDSGEVLRETEVTARYAIAKIRAYQPSGPYHLFGYSYGGVIVFEMARQLQAMGERIGALILADSYLASEHGYYKPGWWRALVHTRQIVRGGPRLLSRRLRERTERLRNAVIQPAASDKAGLLFDAAQRLAHQAFLNYRPGPYSGDVLLLRAKEQFEWMQFARQLPLGGWARVVKGKLEVKDIPGNHLAMLLDPHAGVVAQRVGEYLENVCAMDRASSAALDGREAHAKETQAVVGSLK